MRLSHKIRIYPNQQARQCLAKCFGVSRFAYNWAIDECKRLYDRGEKCPSGYDLSKRLNAIKREQFPWMMEVTKWAPQQAVNYCGKAFRRFLKKQAKYPRYKKRGIGDSVYFAGTTYGISGRMLRISKLKSSIRMAEPVRFPGRILSVTISKRSDQYFASFQIELSEDYIYPNRCENQASVGVDVGIKDLAVLSDGTRYGNPKALRSHFRKLKRLQRFLSRKQKGSSNRSKAKQKLSRLHLRIRNIRQDAIHKMTSEIVRNFRFIGVEDLNVSGMVKNHKLAQSIQDASFYEIRRQLEYKAQLSGSEVVPIHRFYPSSKICSLCGWKNQSLKLSDRTWECAACGIVQDRDLNAARNIEKVALGHRETKNACGAPKGALNQEDAIVFCQPR